MAEPRMRAKAIEMCSALGSGGVEQEAAAMDAAIRAWPGAWPLLSHETHKHGAWR